MGLDHYTLGQHTSQGLEVLGDTTALSDSPMGKAYPGSAKL